ncbi:glycosyl transferase [Phragmitibacter flavus]|uniref:Glycosyl transferase n=1 Tax=Phragmitibacter flavus TaxID=2576071 RepID=A0A5R8KJD3_9BACT|nr:glycosyl transferase [Phragmitibacter flavus]TLD72424.1 glycosyl transferase [Phragmitibacter flavus]
MPDFHQPILLPTLHHLAEPPLEEREALLLRVSAKRPIALVIPVLYNELEREALPHILRQLSKVPYLSRVVFSMNGMDEERHHLAKKFFARRLRQIPHQILWNDGPELDPLHQEIQRHHPVNHQHGKGSNVWMAIAALNASGHHGVIACHDADILNYHREMLWRLCMPVVHPDMNYLFAKSYYGRVRERIYGRVTRLLVFPLIQALREIFGSTPLLRCLAMFRYPLSGEFAADSRFLSSLAVAPDWGLEIGMLCDVFRHAPPQTVCQVDLGSNYEHKHQHLQYHPDTGEPDARSGLMRMAREVSLTLLTHLWTDLGFAAETRKLDRLADAYEETAQILLQRYAHEALFNGLEHVMKEEQQAVTVFSRMLKQLVLQIHKHPPSLHALPSYAEITAADPTFATRLGTALNPDA